VQENVKITTVPSRSKLYQGAVYGFKTELPRANMANDYYRNFYDGRHAGAYFVSSKEVADIYGKKKDESRIVYATIPDVENGTMNQPFLYPMYYIPGIRGSRVTYTTNRALKLLEISDLDNIRMLWKLTEAMPTPRKNDCQFILINTIVDSDQYTEESTKSFTNKLKGWLKLPVDEYGSTPLKLKRVSIQWSDDELVDFFKTDVIPYMQRVYGQKLDGYIYNKMEGSAFHDEIMLIDRTSLIFSNVESEPATEYPGLMSVDEWKKQHDATKVENTRVFPNAITLIPARNIPYRKS